MRTMRKIPDEEHLLTYEPKDKHNIELFKLEIYAERPT